jgi:NAD(P)-dependent dehydrogenase (short-subunit alcohol dehydrogenase family)
LIDLSGRVAIVTGAGDGLGRSHARLMARRGARVVVNDLGETAEAVVREIVDAGGEAIAVQASVADADQMEAMARRALEAWGRIDILVNNAGILRDRTFAKMTIEEFRLVLEVHLVGSFICSKAVWEAMRAQSFGRIVMTTSGAGLFGNFGQANYASAKMALVGLMNSLAIEGSKHNIRVNCLAPLAGTQMMSGLVPPEVMDALKPEAVSHGLLALVREDAPSKTILCAGAGSFELTHLDLTRGIHVGLGDDTAEKLVARWDELADRTDELTPEQGYVQSRVELGKAGHNFGSKERQ